MNQMIAESFLQKWHADVRLCNNGQEAVDILRSETFDIILMDIQMPVMDGFMATEIIRNELKLKSIPIIALTADAMVDVSKKVIDSGMNDVVTKPFDPKSLFAKFLKNLYK